MFIFQFGGPESRIYAPKDSLEAITPSDRQRKFTPLVAPTMDLALTKLEYAMKIHEAVVGLPDTYPGTDMQKKEQFKSDLHAMGYKDTEGAYTSIMLDSSFQDRYDQMRARVHELKDKYDKCQIQLNGIADKDYFSPESRATRNLLEDLKKQYAIEANMYASFMLASDVNKKYIVWAGKDWLKHPDAQDYGEKKDIIGQLADASVYVTHARLMETYNAQMKINGNAEYVAKNKSAKAEEYYYKLKKTPGKDKITSWDLENLGVNMERFDTHLHKFERLQVENFLQDARVAEADGWFGKTKERMALYIQAGTPVAVALAMSVPSGQLLGYVYFGRQAYESYKEGDWINGSLISATLALPFFNVLKGASGVVSGIGKAGVAIGWSAGKIFQLEMGVSGIEIVVDAKEYGGLTPTQLAALGQLIGFAILPEVVRKGMSEPSAFRPEKLREGGLSESYISDKGKWIKPVDESIPYYSGANEKVSIFDVPVPVKKSQKKQFKEIKKYNDKNEENLESFEKAIARNKNNEVRKAPEIAPDVKKTLAFAANNFADNALIPNNKLGAKLFGKWLVFTSELTSAKAFKALEDITKICELTDKKTRINEAKKFEESLKPKKEKEISTEEIPAPQANKIAQTKEAMDIAQNFEKNGQIELAARMYQSIFENQIKNAKSASNVADVEQIIVRDLVELTGNRQITDAMRAGMRNAAQSQAAELGEPTVQNCIKMAENMANIGANATRVYLARDGYVFQATDLLLHPEQSGQIKSLVFTRNLLEAGNFDVTEGVEYSSRLREDAIRNQVEIAAADPSVVNAPLMLKEVRFKEVLNRNLSKIYNNNDGFAANIDNIYQYVKDSGVLKLKDGKPVDGQALVFNDTGYGYFPLFLEWVVRSGAEREGSSVQTSSYVYQADGRISEVIPSLVYETGTNKESSMPLQLLETNISGAAFSGKIGNLGVDGKPLVNYDGGNVNKSYQFFFELIDGVKKIKEKPVGEPIYLGIGLGNIAGALFSPKEGGGKPVESKPSRVEGVSYFKIAEIEMHDLKNAINPLSPTCHIIAEDFTGTAYLVPEVTKHVDIQKIQKYLDRLDKIGADAKRIVLDEFNKIRYAGENQAQIKASAKKMLKYSSEMIKIVKEFRNLLDESEKEVNKRLKIATDENEIKNLKHALSEIMEFRFMLSIDQNTIKYYENNISSLLNYTGSEYIPKIEPFDAIDSIKNVAQKNAHAKMVELTLKLPKKPFMLEYDPSLFEMAMNQVISNAFKYAQEQKVKWVKISAKIEGNDLRIFISDSGEGMTKEQAGKAFEYGVNNENRILGGTGVGLNFAKQVIDGMMGGSIGIRFEPGATHTNTFEIRLNAPKEAKPKKNQIDAEFKYNIQKGKIPGQGILYGTNTTPGPIEIIEKIGGSTQVKPKDDIVLEHGDKIKLNGIWYDFTGKKLEKSNNQESVGQINMAQANSPQNAENEGQTAVDKTTFQRVYRAGDEFIEYKVEGFDPRRRAGTLFIKTSPNSKIRMGWFGATGIEKFQPIEGGAEYSLSKGSYILFSNGQGRYFNGIKLIGMKYEDFIARENKIKERAKRNEKPFTYEASRNIETGELKFIVSSKDEVKLNGEIKEPKTSFTVGRGDIIERTSDGKMFGVKGKKIAELGKYDLLNSVEEWQAEYDRHPEWWNMNPSDMIKDRTYGANEFYQKLSEWTRTQSSKSKERRELIGKVVPTKYRTGGQIEMDIAQPDVLGTLDNVNGRWIFENTQGEATIIVSERNGKLIEKNENATLKNGDLLYVQGAENSCFRFKDGKFEKIGIENAIMAKMGAEGQTPQAVAVKLENGGIAVVDLSEFGSDVVRQDNRTWRIGGGEKTNMVNVKEGDAFFFNGVCTNQRQGAYNGNYVPVSKNCYIVVDGQFVKFNAPVPQMLLSMKMPGETPEQMYVNNEYNRIKAENQFNNQNMTENPNIYPPGFDPTGKEMKGGTAYNKKTQIYSNKSNESKIFSATDVKPKNEIKIGAGDLLHLTQGGTNWSLKPNPDGRMELIINQKEGGMLIRKNESKRIANNGKFEPKEGDIIFIGNEKNSYLQYSNGMMITVGIKDGINAQARTRDGVLLAATVKVNENGAPVVKFINYSDMGAKIVRTNTVTGAETEIIVRKGQSENINPETDRFEFNTGIGIQTDGKEFFVFTEQSNPYELKDGRFEPYVKKIDEGKIWENKMAEFIRAPWERLSAENIDIYKMLQPDGKEYSPEITSQAELGARLRVMLQEMLENRYFFDQRYYESRVRDLKTAYDIIFIEGAKTNYDKHWHEVIKKKQ